ncbi:MAG TPA: hypothetical protein VI229_04115, partial [Burkholderiales bacterium]
KAAKAAAAALKLQIETAFSAYATLLVRAEIEPQEKTQQDIKRFMEQTKAESKAGKWQDVADKLRKEFEPHDLAEAARSKFRVETAEVSKAIADVDAAATALEAAWPFGAGDFVCLKDSVYALTHSLRKVALTFDAPAFAGSAGGSRFTQLSVESDRAARSYVAVLKNDDDAAAAVALQGYRELLATERKQNADVQAAFVRAAQSAADLHAAIEAVESVTVTDVLQLIQRYAPGLSSLDDSIDGEAIAKKAGVVLGKLNKSPWLERYAETRLPSIGPKCKFN